jgi:hypothetical protein
MCMSGGVLYLIQSNGVIITLLTLCSVCYKRFMGRRLIPYVPFSLEVWYNKSFLSMHLKTPLELWFIILLE